MKKILNWFSIVVILSGVILIILSCKCYCQLIDSLFNGTVLAALIGLFGIFLGWREYLRKKQIEEVRDYYIKNGINKVINFFNEANSSVLFNSLQMLALLHILEHIQKNKIGIEPEILLKKFESKLKWVFVSPDISFDVVINKILGLKNENDITKFSADALQNCLIFNNFLFFIIPEDLRKKGYSLFSINHWKEFVDKEIEKIVKYSKILDYFMDLKERIAEIGIFTRNDLKKIQKDKEIKEIIKSLEKKFKKVNKSIMEDLYSEYDN